MAESSAKKLAAQKEELESKGAKAVEALFEANESEVDLDAAQNIGLITADTRAKIKEAFDMDGTDIGKELFRAAMDKQITHHKKPPVEAFKRAFEVVYGKFQLEQRDVKGLEDPDGPLMKVLGKVLRFPIEKIDGKATIKGRPELEAAVCRLNGLLSEKKAAKLLKKMKPQVEADKNTADQETKKIQVELTDLQGRKEKFDSLAGSTEEREKSLDNLVKALKRSERLDTKAKMRLAKQAAKESILAMKLAPDGGDHHFNDRVRYMARIFNAASCMDEIGEIFAMVGLDDWKAGLDKLSPRLKNLSQGPELDLDACRAFLDYDLKSTVELLSGDVFLRRASDTLQNYMASGKFSGDGLDGAELIADLKTKIGKLKEFYKFLNENFSRVKKYYKIDKKLGKAKTKTGAGEVEADIKKEEARLAKEKLVGRMSEFVNGAESLFADGVSAEIQAKIASFAGPFRADIVSGTNSIMTDELENFVNGKYKPFVSDLTEAITEAVSAKTSQASAADENLQRLTEKLKRINSLSTKEVLVEDILKRAFAGVNPLKLLELEREHKEAQAKEEALTEHHKYFSGKGPAEIHGKFLAIKNSVVTSGNVRKKEADFKNAEANKARLDQLKDTFSEAKTSSLLDLFQEFDALKDSYLPTEAGKNLDATITAKSSSVSILEKELEAEFTAKKAQKSRKSVSKSSSVYQERIGQLRTNLEKEMEALEKLKKQKADRDKFKELAKKLRGELQRYCREYLAAFELVPDDGFKSTIEQTKKDLDAMNVESGFNSDKLKDCYRLIASKFSKSFEAVKARLEDTEITLKEKQSFEDEKNELEKAKALHADLKPVIDMIKAAKDLGVNLDTGKPEGINVDAMVKEFEKIKINDINFSAKNLIAFYEKYFAFLLVDPDGKKHLLEMFEKRITGLKSEVKNKLNAVNHEKAAAKTNENLTDAQAAKNIIEAIIAELDPTLPLADREKLSAIMLASDVMKSQSAEDYVALAEHGSADLLDTVKQVGFLEKVIGFQYKVGEKVEKPFEGLKPEQFKEWRGEDGQGIENLFDTRRLDYKGGFLLLAAFETFDGDSAQIGPLEQKLKELLAVALGVEDRMSEAGVVAIVNEAFEKQLEAARPLVQAYFAHVNKKRDVWETNRVRALNTEHKALRDLYRTGQINTEQYRQRLEGLREKAEDAGVLDQVGFAQSSIMKSFAGSEAGKWLKKNDFDAGQALNVFWNNPVSQWFRDRGFDLARTSKNAAVRILGHGVAGTVKLGASLGLQTALMPFRFGKYGLMAAGMPFIGFINLWRKQKWTPYSLKTTVGQDVSKALGYVGEKSKGVVTGVAGTAKDVVAKDFVGIKWEKYEERIKVKPDKAMERAKELWEKGQATALKIASEPWIDLEKYKARIKELDAILAGEKEKKAA